MGRTGHSGETRGSRERLRNPAAVQARRYPERRPYPAIRDSVAGNSGPAGIFGSDIAGSSRRSADKTVSTRSRQSLPAGAVYLFSLTVPLGSLSKRGGWNDLVVVRISLLIFSSAPPSGATLIATAW